MREERGKRQGLSNLSFTFMFYFSMKLCLLILVFFLRWLSASCIGGAKVYQLEAGSVQSAARTFEELN